MTGAPPGRRAARWALAAAVALHLAVLYWPRSPSTGSGFGLDKVVHAVLFGAVVLAGARAGLRLGPLVGLLLAHAVVSEGLQALVLPARSGDWGDVLADVVGTVLAALLVRPGGRMDPWRRWSGRPSTPPP